MALRIHLLGPLSVETDAGLVSLPARKSEALLAVLALRPGVACEREWLAALLWPDVPEAQGRTSLRQALGHLRKQLGEELVTTGADRVHLNPKAAWVDAAELDRLLRRAPAERAGAIELCRGALLQGFPSLEDPFGDWQRQERERLRERISARLEECLAALSANGDFDAALRVGTQLLELDPTREGVHRALMRLHAERGDRSAALRQYTRCRESLRRHLELEPTAETEGLRRELSVVEATAGKGAAPGSVEPPLPSRLLAGRTLLAVLPFEPLGAERDAPLLASALSEDVTTELSRFPQLALIARSSVAALAEHSKSPSVIARETGARLLLTGSVLVAAARARVTAALTDPTTGLELWSERWELPHGDLFGILDRLTRSVVGALALRIDENQLQRARLKPPERLEVYECWLRGLECLRRGTPGSDSEARRFFEQALALDPNFGRAYSGISLSYFNDWSCQAWDRWDERERSAFEHARRAVELDESDPVTHCILGRIYVYRRQFALGARHLERSLALNPHDTDSLMHSALAFAQLGEPERACELADAALRLNPKYPDWYCAAAAFPQFVARHLDGCVELALRAPDAFVDTRALLAAAHAHQGKFTEARAHGALFLQHFQLKIAGSGPVSEREAVAWLLRVSPLQREADQSYLVDGLELAGVPAP